ncbi:lytic murein transglycosylase [Pseudomonas sp. PDNC002]|uniref:lytic murein transglycosylase n=1 Tax=Pseudomonas sp. PDNC002 TaxID=2811422 RepID=UPI00196635F6|nr:lytic murein transglycosylase [Pseudomonas sp. PDNC002]QRY81238.1 lytic murein transglycosylase [Pseudomonas sp. PDNC002]
MRKPVSPVVGQRCLLAVTLSLAAFGLLSSCAEAPTRGAPSAVAQAQPSQSFDQWRDGFRAQALAAGISAQTFDTAFDGIEPDDSVVTADRSQPEFTRPVWQYLDSAVSPARVRNGQDHLLQNDAALQRIEARYGVERQAVVAIWGMESNFGAQMGSKNVIRSLATLAYEGRRPDFGRDQLIAALQILQHGDVPASSMIGSWAGAMGQTQFIPTTYQRYAVDFDGDGRRDIWASSTDALASTANYLSASGWQRGQPWGFEVRLPPTFDYAQADMEIRKPLAEWQRLGVQPASGNLAVDPQTSASLLLPAGYRGPAFLVTDNFRAILKYNNSTSYALAVGLLADSLNGGGQLVGHWPVGDAQLSRTDRVELQQRLSERGFAAGSADGVIGANTRRALRDYQKTIGEPADGYPTADALQRLRAP